VSATVEPRADPAAGKYLARASWHCGRYLPAWERLASALRFSRDSAGTSSAGSRGTANRRRGGLLTASEVRAPRLTVTCHKQADRLGPATSGHRDFARDASRQRTSHLRHDVQISRQRNRFWKLSHMGVTPATLAVLLTYNVRHSGRRRCQVHGPSTSTLRRRFDGHYLPEPRRSSNCDKGEGMLRRSTAAASKVP